MSIKKYHNFINESKIDDAYTKISSLRFFIIDRRGLNMRDVIDSLIREESKVIDYNEYYQLPLSILSKTGKYPDIRLIDGKWYSRSLSNVSLVVDDSGKWHPVNKLNTNYADVSKLLCDLFEKMGLLDEINNQKTQQDLERYLLNFKLSNNIHDLIKTHIPDIKIYTERNRKFSEIGELAEIKVADIIKSKGVDILYQGGDGDLIDMIYGTDLIVRKEDKIYLVQVKSKPEAAKLALDESLSGRGNYSKIDWFCAPLGNTIIIYTKGHPTGKVIK